MQEFWKSADFIALFIIIIIQACYYLKIIFHLHTSTYQFLPIDSNQGKIQIEIL